MLNENPYQSPQIDSNRESNPSPTDGITTQRPSWRFWVLALTCLPGFAMLFIAFKVYSEIAIEWTPGPPSIWSFAPIVLALVILFLGACVTIFVFWREPARTSPGIRSTLVLGALCTLAAIAIPSTFSSICTATAVAGAAMRIDMIGAASAFLFGIGGGILTGRLAVAVWRDAIGRSNIK